MYFGEKISFFKMGRGKNTIFWAIYTTLYKSMILVTCSLNGQGPDETVWQGMLPVLEGFVQIHAEPGVLGRSIYRVNSLTWPLFFWHLVKSDFSIVHVFSSVHWKSHFLQGTRKHSHVWLVTLYLAGYPAKLLDITHQCSDECCRILRWFDYKIFFFFIN